MDILVSQKLVEYFKSYKQQKFKKGKILIRADEDPSGIIYIQEGSIKQYAISKKGEELIVNVFKKGAFFPVSWALNQTPNSYYYEALENITTYKSPKDEVINFLKVNPDVLLDLMSRVYKGTDGILLRMVYLMSGEAYSQVILELLIYAKRFSQKKASLKNIELNLSEKTIANQAGIARETVSREIKLLKEKDLVTLLKNKIIIKDLELLEEELIRY